MWLPPKPSPVSKDAQSDADPGPDVQASAIAAMANAMMAEDQQFQRKPYYIALAVVAYDALRALAQSNTEPVAWQWRVPGKDWPELSCGKDHAEYMRSRGAEIRPVFASPRSDASAGLIEAAEWIAFLLRPLEWVATAILTVLIFGAAILRNAIDRSAK